MEQVIHTFGLDWKLLLIQTVNFLLLLIILKHFLYKPILSFITARQNLIAKGVQDATEASKKLSQAEDSASRTRTEALREAEKVATESRRLGEERKEAIIKEATLRASLVAEEAVREGAEIKARAIRESEEEVTKLSLLAAEKILRSGGTIKHAR